LAKTSIFEMAGVPLDPQIDDEEVGAALEPEALLESPPKREVGSIFELADTYQPPAEEAFLTNEQVLKDPLKLKVARDYMITRQGDYYKTAKDEDVLDDFVDHMRWVSTNEVSTVGEAYSVFDLKEEQKPVYSDAYKLYDELGTAYQAGGVGELGDAALHYTGSILSSPSSWVGGFLGRAVSKPVTRGITAAAAKSLKTGVTKEVAKTTIKEAAKAVEKQVVKNAGLVAAKKTRNEVITAAVIGTTVDAGLSTAQEKLLQDTRVQVGAQEEVDWSSVAIASAFGVVGGGMAYFPEAMRGTIKLTDAGEKMTKAAKIRAVKAKAEVGLEMEQAAKKLATDWDSVAAHGQDKDAAKFLRDKAIGWFFDWDEEKSFVRILHRAGADLGGDDKTFSHKVVEYARGLPPQNRAAITKTLKPFGVNFGELIEIFAGALKEGGENLSKASQASRAFADFKNVSLAKRQAITNTAEAEAERALAEAGTKTGAKTAPVQSVKYLTSVWKRLIISHPATTMLNVKGWGVATTARTFSEIVHGGVLGSVGLVQKLAGSSAADKTLARSAAMFKSNLFLARSLMDPYTTVEGFTDLLEAAPAKHKKTALGAFFGGVGDEKPEMFGISSENRLVKRTEKTIDAAARLTFVRTQDIYTKSITGLKELDKMSRIELGMGIEELVAKGKSHMITDDMWDKVSKTLLEDTFSVDYTKGGGVFNEVAKLLETTSNTPWLGFLFPFGRFVNNTVGYTFQYSPLAFFPFTKFQKGLDLEERLAKATVGTVALTMVYSREKEKQAEGLQWNEERTSTGEVKDVSRIFPVSLYNLVGRVLVDSTNGSGVPLALFDELVKQVGPLGSLKDATSSNPITDMITMMTKASEDDDGATLLEVAGQVASMVVGAGASIAAGFTRPLDPVNDMAGMALNSEGIVNDGSIDRKMAEGTDVVLQNFARYTNNFFSLALGEDTGEGRMLGVQKNSATDAKPVKDSNPLGSMFGSTTKPRQDSIDIILGMTDLAPFTMDSMTTGVPEYDNFINGTIFPILERKSEALLESDFFKSRPTHIKRRMVSKMLTTSRKEILENLENGSLGSFQEYLFNERKNFMALDQAYRAEAKRALDIDVEDRKLTLDQIEKLSLWIDVVKELDDEFVTDQ